MSLIGASVPRREDEHLLRGQGRYLADVQVAGALEAAFVRAPVSHAHVEDVDSAAARALPGVVAVFEPRDLARHVLVDSVAIEGLLRTPQPALTTRVRHQGEAVALVVADSRAVAEDAAELVGVAYTPLPTLMDEKSARSSSARLHEDVPGNVVFDRTLVFGSPAEAFEAAAHVVEASHHGGRVTAMPLEPRGCLAISERGRLTVHASTQGPHLLRRRLCSALGLRESDVVVHVPDVGGGFGQKIPAAAEDVAVCAAALGLGSPVRWVEDRRENLIVAPQAKEQLIDLALALDADGRFLALRAEIVGDCGAYSHNSASALIEPFLSAGLMPGPYRIDNLEARVVAVMTNKPPVSPYRGVGWTTGHTAREWAIERAARALGRDAAELRMQNLIPADALPYRTCTGMNYDSGSHREATAEALRRARAQRDELSPLTPHGRIGIGISPYVEPGAWGSRGARESLWSFASHDAVRLTVHPSGSVTADVGSPSQGQGHATVLAQVVSAELGVRLDDVAVRTDDTDRAPISTSGTRASRTAVVVGGALALAARRLRGALLDVAGAVAGEPIESFAESELRTRSGQSITLRQVAEAAHFDPAVREHVPEPLLSVLQFHDPPGTYSNGCVAAVVEVDPELGAVDVRALIAVEDCGTMLNPRIVEEQVRGAVAQGLGMALLEEACRDDDGRPLTYSLLDYRVPKATDVPPIEVGHLCSPSPHTVHGAKGMGESGAIAAPAAIANAIFDGIHDLPQHLRLPLTPERVMSATTPQPSGGSPCTASPPSS